MTDQPTLLKAVSFLAGDRRLEPHQIKAFQRAWDGMSPQAQAEFAATWKGKPKNPDPAQPSLSAAVAAALPLIREFEGCSLVAYPDPEIGGELWTIGWGSTTDLNGTPFKSGDRISQEMADDLLSLRVAHDEQLLARGIPCWGQLSTGQRAALLSFSYNCGNGWFGGQRFTTLTRALMDGRFDDVPAALMLYVNPGGASEAGLRRRRKAEGELWTGSIPAAQGGPIALDVPYYSQRDSASGQGERMCFSSTCAMAAAFLKPGCLAGSGQPDDRYLSIVKRFGDTTAAEAQVKALGTLGVRARFRTDGDMDALVAELRAGRPVPGGWLHRGAVSAPSGGGHWTLAIGWDPASRQVIMHDPYGEANLTAGGYVTIAVGSGRARRYSEGNWGKRWMVDGPGSGWWLQLSV